MYNFFMKRALVCLSIVGCLLSASWRTQTWSLTKTGLQPTVTLSGKALESIEPVDMNNDGQSEEIHLQNGRVELRQGQARLWSSPESWRVGAARLGDLNRDGLPELVLLVWRPWQPWPVDKVLPYGGRIAGFQNADGMSCHLILIGWRGQSFGERWAGSALADPLNAIEVADLDGDGRIELAALEGSYLNSPSSPADSLTIWAWNGFGFGLIDRQPGSFRNLSLITTGQRVILATTP